MSRARFLATVALVARKEALHLARDPRSQALTVALPLVAMAAFAFSFGGQDFTPSGAAAPYPLAVQDLDASAGSVRFVELLARTGLFTLHVLPSDADPQAYLRTSGAFGAVVIPDGFGRALEAGRPQVAYVYDNSKPYVGALALARVKAVLEHVAAQQGVGLAVDDRRLVDTSGRLDVFTPGIVVLLLALTSLHDVTTSFARERADGTLARAFLAPVPRGALVAGKVAAFLLLALARAVVVLAVAVLALGVHVHGPVLAYLLLAATVALATLGLGVLLVARARTEREAMVATLIAAFVLLFLMGALTPVDLMSPAARTLALLVPHAHATEAMRRVLLLGDGVVEIAPALLLLAAVGGAMLAAGTWALRRQVH